MSKRLLVVASVFIAILVVVLVATRDEGRQAPVASPSSPPALSASASPSPSRLELPSSSPSPTASSSPAISFAATGELVSGWYWLRDDAHRASATWTFAPLPVAGDLVLELEVLAADETDEARGQDARFFLAWAPAVPVDAGGWSGRLPVTLPNVSSPDDPASLTCRGTVTIPRSTLAGATTLVVRVSRDDVRGELPASDVPIAVRASSVSLRSP